jgi:hypothetical protein
MSRWLQGTPFLGAVLLTVAAQAGADQIVMRTGGRIDGVVVEQTATAVVIETGPGRVTLPMSRVAQVVKGHSALDTWREQSASLHAVDVQGWAALARWAGEAGLSTQSADAWYRVLASDPHNVEANRAVGHVQVGGTWLGEDEAYRARGYVMYEGRWVSQAEQEALLRERFADEASEQQRYEAGLRAREAEARAREAEARAREAEAAASPSGDDGGIPFYIAYGGGGYGHNPYGYRYRNGQRQPHGGAGQSVPPAGVHPAPRGTAPASLAPSVGSRTTQPPRPAAGLMVPPPRR